MTITKSAIGECGCWRSRLGLLRATDDPRRRRRDCHLPQRPAAPSVTAISPSTGSTARPTPVTITGTGFLPGATVTVDVVAMSVTVVNSTTITAIVRAHAAGHADVVVTNPGGSGGTLPAAFTYVFDELFTVTPSSEAVDAGGQMSVSWTAPTARAGRLDRRVPGRRRAMTTTGGIIRMARRPARTRSVRRRGRGSTSSATWWTTVFSTWRAAVR